MSCTQTRIELRTLSNFSTDPQRAGVKMVEATKSNVKLARQVQAVNLIEGLVIRKVGTNAIEKLAKVLTEESERNEGVVVKLMRIVRDVAKGKERKAILKFYSDKRDAKKPAGWMRKNFLRIMRKEADSEWQSRIDKNMKKKNHLERRAKPRKEGGRFRVIAVGDAELGRGHCKYPGLGLRSRAHQG